MNCGIYAFFSAWRGMPTPIHISVYAADIPNEPKTFCTSALPCSSGHADVNQLAELICKVERKVPRSQLFATTSMNSSNNRAEHNSKKLVTSLSRIFPGTSASARIRNIGELFLPRENTPHLPGELPPSEKILSELKRRIVTKYRLGEFHSPKFSRFASSANLRASSAASASSFSNSSIRRL